MASGMLRVYMSCCCFGPFFPSSFCLGQSWVLDRCLRKRFIDEDTCADPGSQQYFVLGIIPKQLPADSTLQKCSADPVRCVQCHGLPLLNWQLGCCRFALSVVRSSLTRWGIVGSRWASLPTYCTLEEGKCVLQQSQLSKPFILSPNTRVLCEWNDSVPEWSKHAYLDLIQYLLVLWFLKNFSW